MVRLHSSHRRKNKHLGPYKIGKASRKAAASCGRFVLSLNIKSLDQSIEPRCPSASVVVTCAITHPAFSIGVTDCGFMTYVNLAVAVASFAFNHLAFPFFVPDGFGAIRRNARAHVARHAH